MNEESHLLREASRQSLITFIHRTMPQMIPDYVHFPYVDLISAKIEHLVGPPQAGRLAINLPPRHGKSFILIATAAWYLGNYPEREVLLMTHSQSLANDLAGKVSQLLRSQLFLEIFPKFQLMEGRESMADFRTSKGGGFKAGGFDTGITGRGADLLLIDDALSAQDASSSAARTFVCDTFDNMLATRINDPKTGAIISMSHRLNQNDLSDHLIRRGFDHIKLPFQATEDETFICGGVHFKRKSGELLQADRWPVDYVRTSGLASHVFATQYQQEPTPVGSGILAERHFPLAQTCPTGGQTIISWDTAWSMREGASYSVGLVFQMNSDVAYLKHILRDRLDYSRLKERALHLHSTFGPTLHLVEAASLGIALASDLRASGANVIEVKVGAASKEDRLNSVLNQIEANYVRPVEGIANLREFLDECTAFPNGTNDDLVDALTQFLNWHRENPPKPKHPPVVLISSPGGRGVCANNRTMRWRH